MMNIYNFVFNAIKNMTDEEWERIKNSVDYDMIKGGLVSEELTVLLIKLMEEKWGIPARQPVD